VGHPGEEIGHPPLGISDCGAHLGLHLGLHLGGEPGDLGRVLAREQVLSLGKRLDDAFERESGPLELRLDAEPLDEMERLLHT
jgi:hypothetical protein